MMTEIAYCLIHDAFQHGDASGLPAFLKHARSRCAKEIAKHVANFARLTALYDKTPDGEVEAVCDALAAEEDWLAAKLGF
jgi:hypothetical protein